MRPVQVDIIAHMGVKPRIEPAEEVARRVHFLASYMRASAAAGCVLGISGGVDSSLAGRLCQLAVEQLRSQATPSTFVAVRLPYHQQADESDAQMALAFIRPDCCWSYNIGPAVDGLVAEYGHTGGGHLSDFSKGNIKARIRMSAQYALAGEHQYLVVGTDHAAESVTGFFTKYGDGGADILPLFGMNKRQNRALLHHLGAPEALCTKTPTADLLDAEPGRADEDELGLQYDDIDDYLEGKTVPTPVAEAIERRFFATRHKRAQPVTIFDHWWQHEPSMEHQ